MSSISNRNRRGRSAAAFGVIALAAILLVAMAATGCSSGGGGSTGTGSTSQDTASLQNVTWGATEIADTAGKLAPVVPGSSVTAVFTATDISGTGGINRYSATYKTTSPNGIAITMGPSTLMAGPQDLMAQESAFFVDMAAAKTYTVTADKLELMDSAGNVVVRFTPQKPVSLTTTTWYCTSYNNGKQAVVSVEASSEITAIFAPDGHLSGSAGVNTYSTQYQTGGDTISINSAIALTQKAGPPALMAQEAAYVAALPKASTFEIDGTTLVLWQGKGSTAARIAEYTSVKP